MHGSHLRPTSITASSAIILNQTREANIKALTATLEFNDTTIGSAASVKGDPKCLVLCLWARRGSRKEYHESTRFNYGGCGRKWTRNSSRLRCTRRQGFCLRHRA